MKWKNKLHGFDDRSERTVSYFACLPTKVEVIMCGWNILKYTSVTVLVKVAKRVTGVNFIAMYTSRSN